MNKLRTSKLWWLGCGFTIKYRPERDEFIIRTGVFGKLRIDKHSMRRVWTEKKFLRGRRLVIDGVGKRYRFRYTWGKHSYEAKQFIMQRASLKEVN